LKGLLVIKKSMSILLVRRVSGCGECGQVTGSLS
jgi:hypothetical protein